MAELTTLTALLLEDADGLLLEDGGTGMLLDSGIEEPPGPGGGPQCYRQIHHRAGVRWVTEQTAVPQMYMHIG